MYQNITKAPNVLNVTDISLQVEIYFVQPMPKQNDKNTVHI